MKFVAIADSHVIMKTKILLLLLLFSGQHLFSQISNDSINRYNSKNKKEGFWKVYLTDYLIETKDSSKAYYYAYDYYINGKLIIWTSSAQYYKKKAAKVVSDLPVPKIGNPTLLTGNFKFYYVYGLGLDEIYKDGLPIVIATCYPNSVGQSIRIEIADFSKKYNNQLGSFLYERYNIDGKLTYRRWSYFNKKGKLVTIKDP